MTVLISAGSGVLAGILSLIGVIITNNAHDKVMEERIANLTREVRKHNDFAERIPKMEEKIDNLFHRYEELYEMKSKTS